MVTLRTCKHVKDDGQLCGSPPLLDDVFCFMHSPEHAQEAAEARRLGGPRRRILETAKKDIEDVRTGLRHYVGNIELPEPGESDIADTRKIMERAETLYT